MSTIFTVKFKDGRVGRGWDPRGVEAVRKGIVTRMLRRRMILIEGAFGFDGDDDCEDGVYRFYANEIASIEPN